MVDGEGAAGWYASLVLDSRSEPRIAYYSVATGTLKYAARAGGSWVTETVDAELSRVSREPVPEEELERAKARGFVEYTDSRGNEEMGSDAASTSRIH